MESPGVGFEFPELVLGPELFVTWRGPCPLSCAPLRGPSVLGLACRRMHPWHRDPEATAGAGRAGRACCMPGATLAVTGWEDEGDKRQQRPAGRTSEMKALKAGLGPSRGAHVPTRGRSRARSPSLHPGAGACVFSWKGRLPAGVESQKAPGGQARNVDGSPAGPRRCWAGSPPEQRPLSWSTAREPRREPGGVGGWREAPYGLRTARRSTACDTRSTVRG